VVLGAICAAIAAVCEASLSWLMLPLVDGGFQQAPISWLAQFQHPPLWVIPISLIGLFAIRGIAGFVVDYALAWTANHATMNLRLHLFDRLLDVETSLFASRSTSSLTNTVVYEAVGGVGQLTGAAQTLLKDTFSTLALLGTLLMLNWQLTLFIAVLVPVLSVTMRAFGKRMHKIIRSSQLAVDRLGYVVEENILAWRVVRLHGVQKQQALRFKEESRSLFRLMMKSTIASAAATPLIQLFTAMALAAVIGAALWQSSSTGTPMGAFAASFLAAIGIATPIRRLTEVSSTITRGLASVERGLQLIHDSAPESGGSFACERASGHFVLRDVGVRFDAPDEPWALSQINLDIAPGSVVALVGPSGAGKSTLANLLPRFLLPTQGVVELDGVPLPAWHLQSLRSQIALVSQDVVLLNDTVEQNVCVGNVADPVRVCAALKAAHLLDAMEALPEGLQTGIGHNGTRLSGGQRQRLAIARAIYKDAPIIILDEATSALDSESEQLIQQAMTNLMRNRTNVVIAHRLSTIANADKVVVLEAGRIVETGSHAQLMACGGLYAKLHAIQFGAFENDAAPSVQGS